MLMTVDWSHGIKAKCMVTIMLHLINLGGTQMRLCITTLGVMSYRRPNQKLIKRERERGRSGFMLEDQSGNSRFWTYARAEDFTKSRSSVKCICLEVYMFCSLLERENSRSSEDLIRSSEGSHARAELLCLHVCSSVESHARARPLFQQKFEKCFKVSRHRTGARSVELALVLSSQPPCLTSRFQAFGNHGLLAGCNAKPIGAGLGRDRVVSEKNS
ncbi:hypothetical protein CsSME_00050584 [Camellia sinensis var. sinensis]